MYKRSVVSVLVKVGRSVKFKAIDFTEKWWGTLEILVSHDSPWKKGLSQAPCDLPILMPLSQSLSRTNAEQHCSWAILDDSHKKQDTSSLFSHILIKG